MIFYFKKEKIIHFKNADFLKKINWQGEPKANPWLAIVNSAGKQAIIHRFNDPLQAIISTNDIYPVIVWLFEKTIILLKDNQQSTQNVFLVMP